MTTSAQAHMVINLPHTPGSVGALSSAKKLNGLNYYWNRYNMTDDRYDKPLPHKLKKNTHFIRFNKSIENEKRRYFSYTSKLYGFYIIVYNYIYIIYTYLG